MDKTDMIYDIVKEMKEDLEMVKSDVSDLKAFKNRLIGGSVAAGAIFATCFEFIKNLWTGR